MRFFGPRGDLLAAESPGLVVYDGSGHVRVRTEIDDFLDVAPVGDELWVVGQRQLIRLSARDGRELGRDPIDDLDPDGRFLLSSTAPQLPVWHGAQPVVIRTGPVRTEVPGPGGEVILPISDGRWLLWQGGQLRLWRSIGEAWRKPIGEPGSRTHDAQLVLDGRLFALTQQRPPRAGDDGELRLTVAAVSDGAQHTQLRLPAVAQLLFAARRGAAIARSGDRLSLIDLRFGRWIRDLALPAGVTDLAVDDGLQWFALASADGLEVVRPDALAQSGAHAASASDDAAPAAGNGESHAVSIEVIAGVAPRAAEAPAGASDEPARALDAPDAPGAPDAAVDLPDAPLLRLDPVSVTPTATDDEIARSIELRLQLIGARTLVAIAEAWDSGRISKTDPMRPPFADEVGGLLRVAAGRAPAELEAAYSRLQAADDLVIADEHQPGRPADAARRARPRLPPVRDRRRDPVRRSSRPGCAASSRGSTASSPTTRAGRWSTSTCSARSSAPASRHHDHARARRRSPAAPLRPGPAVRTATGRSPG